MESPSNIEWAGRTARARPSWAAVGQPGRLGLGERGRGRHDPDRRVERLFRGGGRRRRRRRQQRGALGGRGTTQREPIAAPRQPAGGIDHPTRGVHDGERSDDGPADVAGGGADAALESTRHGPGPGPDGAAPRCRAAGAVRRPRAELGRRPVAEASAPTEVEDDRGRNDGNDLLRLVVEADWKAEAAVLEPRHHTVGGGEAVRTAAGEADGVHRRDEVLGTQRVGLPRSRSAAPHVHARCRPCRHDHRRGPGAPTAADPLVVADSGRQGRP